MACQKFIISVAFTCRRIIDCASKRTRKISVSTLVLGIHNIQQHTWMVKAKEISIHSVVLSLRCKHVFVLIATMCPTTSYYCRRICRSRRIQTIRLLSKCQQQTKCIWVVGSSMKKQRRHGKQPNKKERDLPANKKRQNFALFFRISSRLAEMRSTLLCQRR